MANRLVVSEREMAAVWSLTAPERYSYFIKRVADWQTAWSLWDAGWALAGDDEERKSIPLWPALEYANACAVDQWEGYQPEGIELTDLLDRLLIRLRGDGVFVAVFPTPTLNGVVIDPEELATSLREERRKYE